MKSSISSQRKINFFLFFISTNSLSKDLALKVRVDKQELLDLNINCNTLIDRKSGVDFSHYIRERVKY